MIEQQMQLPEGWEWKALGDVVKLKNGFAFKSTDFCSEGIPVIRISDLDGEAVSIKKSKKVPNKLFNPDFQISKGDLLIAMSGATTGKVGIVKFDVPVLQNQRVGNFKIIDSKKLIEGYRNYYVTYLRRKIEKAAYGGAQPNISAKLIESFKIPLPEISIQKQIVAKIEELFSHVDAGIESLKIAKEKLKQYRQSVLKAAVTGELTKDWRQANQHKIEPADQLLQRILKERRQRWEQQQLDQFTAKGKMPTNNKWKEKYQEPKGVNFDIAIQGWSLVSLEQLAKVGTGATPKRGNSAYYQDGIIPWVTSGALNDLFITQSDEYITEQAIKETNVSVFPKHTLLIAMYGEGKTRGKVSELLIEAGTNQACAGIVLEGIAGQCKNYLKIFFLKNYDDIRRLSSGGVQPNLNLSIIKATEIPCPPLEEQKEIVRMVEEKLTAADRLMTEINTKLTQAHQQKQTILSSAFSGSLLR